MNLSLAPSRIARSSTKTRISWWRDDHQCFYNDVHLAHIYIRAIPLQGAKLLNQALKEVWTRVFLARTSWAGL